MKKVPIEVMFQALKQCAGCDRILVVTGEIGGRGVSYHDSDHEKILTDMFLAVDVPDNRQVTAHGEMLIQACGRLCTIFTMENPPTVRLWASPSVHRVAKDARTCTAVSPSP